VEEELDDAGSVVVEVFLQIHYRTSYGNSSSFRSRSAGNACGLSGLV
jgi:hypothetical protein